eukprot:GHRR01005600.1.p1 GENE.GHRR01005600.1~~GHRR01005600.1.p1  ORF type:complete len:377 (+),score=95.60 GHRR01005600.1:256-1386(+)
MLVGGCNSISHCRHSLQPERSAGLAGPGPSSLMLMNNHIVRQHASWPSRQRRHRQHLSTCTQAAISTCQPVSSTALASNLPMHLGHSQQHAGMHSTSAQHYRSRQCRPAHKMSVQTCGASLALPVLEPAAAAVGSAIGAAPAFNVSKLLAVGLGYAVMAGSLFRSVPQIMKVLQHRSTEGLSLTSYIVELCCYSVTIAYNLKLGYGFNTFGEVCACWAQDIALIALIFRFSQTQKWAVAATGGLLALGCAWLMSPACPAHVLALLQASNIVTMALGSRLPQIVLNMRRGNAGVLSVTTCILNVAGNAARIFTTIVLTGDLLLLGGYLSQGTLNTILLCQSVGTARQKRHGAVILSDQHRRSSGPDASGGLQMQPAA